MKLVISVSSHKKTCSNYIPSRIADDRGTCKTGCPAKRVGRHAMCPFDIEGDADATPPYQPDCPNFK